MNHTTARPRFLRILFPLIAIAALLGTTVPTVAAHGDGTSLSEVRRVTARYHQLDRALADGYGTFYVCTDNQTPGVGAMGQHYVNGDLVGDPALDPLHPEVLVYEPMPNGRSRLVALEYVVLQADWHAAFGDTTPSLFGQELEAVGAGNRYGLPPFYELHVWLWKYNPSGLFSDWNPRVSCHGTGDPA